MATRLGVLLATLAFLANMTAAIPAFAQPNSAAKPAAKVSTKAPANPAKAKTTTASAPAASAPAAADKENLAPVLPPEQFFGAAAMGYSAAKANPHVCSKLFCYCGCDITDNHNNLLDCF